MAAARTKIPKDRDEVVLTLGGKSVKLTHLQKIFWSKLQLTKGDLLQYYIDVSPWLLPHIENRPLVMKRYPQGAAGKFFYMKRAPEPRPAWVRTCTIEHRHAGPVPYPLVDDLASLLWMVNLGCIDLNPWYSTCPDFNRPDFLHFDLDPVPGVKFAKVCEAALLLREHLDLLKMPSWVKTSGATGLHVYVPIVHGPLQKEVWHVAKSIAFTLAARHRKILTSEYRIAKRPKGTVLVDYNQNAWGKTLASVYSVRPNPQALVSAPLTWEEVAKPVQREEFTLQSMPARLRRVGDLWKGLLGKKRFDLGRLIEASRGESYRSAAWRSP